MCPEWNGTIFVQLRIIDQQWRHIALETRFSPDVAWYIYLFIYLAAAKLRLNWITESDGARHIADKHSCSKRIKKKVLHKEKQKKTALIGG